MKQFLTAVFVLVATVAFSQTPQQSGIPAKVTAANGKEFPVFLQRIDGDKIVFQLYKSTSNKAVPSKLITKLDFVGRFDAAGTEQLFTSGDYQGMLDKMGAELAPSLDDYWQYMPIENNLQDVFCMLMKAYLRMGNVPKAMEVSTILLQNTDPSVNGPAQSIAILAALGDGKIEEAEGMLDNVESEPGKLYLRACIARAKGLPKDAIELVDDLIANYGNDLAWMPQAELLDAQIYEDMGMTNSAINTARQVKNIYANSSIGTDAEKLHAELKAAQEKAAAAAKAREEAEAAQAAEVKARAAERAKGVGFHTMDKSDSETNTVDQAGSDGNVETGGSDPGDSTDAGSSSNSDG